MYGIFDRVTIEEAKLPRLKEDIVKILSMTKKFGIYTALEHKQSSDSALSKSLDKDVFNMGETVRRFTDKNYCPDFDLTYPDFTPQHFSANRAEGACPVCHGLGEILDIDFEKTIDPFSPYTKALLPWRDSMLGQTILKKIAEKYSIDQDKLWKDLPERFRQVVIEGDGELLRLGMGGKYTSMYYRGLKDVLTSQFNKGVLTVDFQSMFELKPCEECGGAKLRKESMHVFLYTGPTGKQPQNFKTEGKSGLLNLFDFQKMPMNDLIKALEHYKDTSSKAQILVNRILLPLINRAKTIQGLGLGHLTLTRQVDTLSGGEIQRLRLAKQLGNKLTGITYVLDEPTIGLDDGEVERTIQAIKSLKEMGNTILVVEHNDAFIRASDWVVEIGPSSGDFGGQLLFNGPYTEFIKSDTLTAQYIRGDKKIEITFDHQPTGNNISVKKASGNNLQSIDVDIKV